MIHGNVSQLKMRPLAISVTAPAAATKTAAYASSSVLPDINGRSPRSEVFFELAPEAQDSFVNGLDYSSHQSGGTDHANGKEKNIFGDGLSAFVKNKISY